MTIIIKKGDTHKEIEDAKKQMRENTNRPVLADFYGKLKGTFGDGITY